MKRNTKISCDVSREADNMLKAYCLKHERSKGFLLEKMIRKFCGEVEVATAAQVVVVKKPKTKPVEVTYPIKLNIEAWDKWIAFRKVAKFKAYKSDATMKKLSEMGNHGEQMLIVQNSIDCEYQGLFALKANNSAAGKTSGNLSACEAFING